MVNSFRFKILVILFAMLFADMANAQTLTAKVNRSTVPQGETFVYVLELNGKVDAEPDLSALNKDFQIYSTNQTVNNIDINGAVIDIKQWQVALGALRKGTFVIPPIKLGNQQSNPVTVKVVDAEAAAKENKADAFISKIDVVLNNDRPFVQQQINYTIVLTDSRPIQIEGTQLMDDGSNAWIIKELKPAEVEIGEVDGSPVRIFKFYLALFPQKSGFTKTPEFRILGYYLTKPKMMSGKRGFGVDFDDVFMQKNSITLATKQMDVEVRPVREKDTWWLPAKKVEMISEFEPLNPTFKVGEAINRTVKIAARGVLESQLPEIKFAKIEGMKQYPSKPVVEQTLRGDDVVATKSVSNVYIPTREGEMVLPEIRVNWFNVDTLRQETAVLPAIKVMVEAGDIAMGGDENTESLNTTHQKPVKDTPPSTFTNASVDEVGLAPAWLIAVVAFVLGMLVAYVVLRPRDKDVNHKKMALKALANKDYKLARDEILIWARGFYGNARLHNLNDVGRVANHKELARLLNELENSLYSDKVVEFDAKALRMALEKAGKGKALEGNKEPLPKLY